MERNFKRISEELKLPQESRERIRSHLASYKMQQEDIPMKKAINISIPLVVAAIVTVMALMLTAGAWVMFRNDTIVSSKDDIPPYTGASYPNGTPPTPLEEMIENDRRKTDDWAVGDIISGGVLSEYFDWDFFEVLSSDPTLRSRRVWRADGAEKIEYTAENPNNLLDTLTGRVTFDLSWMNDQYDYVPDANISFVVTDKKGNYVSELFQALYAKPDGSRYVRVRMYNTAEEDLREPNYIVEGIYETAYYYTTADGYEFLIRLHNGVVWVDCVTSHATVGLDGAYLSTDEIENILENLSLSINE